MTIDPDTLQEISLTIHKLHGLGAVMTFRVESGNPIIGYKPKEVVLTDEVKDGIKRNKNFIIEIMQWQGPTDQAKTVEEALAVRKLADVHVSAWWDGSIEDTPTKDQQRIEARWYRAESRYAELVAQKFEELAAAA